MIAGKTAIFPRAAHVCIAARVCIWTDGVYLDARMEPAAGCILVSTGATPGGRTALPGIQVGIRESAQNWRELLVSVKARGVAIAREVAVGPSR